MSVVYRDVLERFVKYREQRNISQNELAQMLCISQSYVSKMEVGKARISFDILTALYQQGWDIDYIITGQENHRTVLNDLYESCKEDCRADFLQYMIWTVIKEKDAMMFFRKDGILYPVKCNRVIYMELIKRKICIHMKNGDVLSIPYKSFREIMEEANYEKFVQCSRNCVINIDYIKNIDKTNRFITLEGTKTAVEMGGTFIKKVVGVLGL